MTEADLREIEERAKRAGPGDSILAAVLVCRQDIPALIAEVRRLKEEER